MPHGDCAQGQSTLKDSDASKVLIFYSIWGVITIGSLTAILVGLTLSIKAIIGFPNVDSLVYDSDNFGFYNTSLDNCTAPAPMCCRGCMGDGCDGCLDVAVYSAYECCPAKAQMVLDEKGSVA